MAFQCFDHESGFLKENLHRMWQLLEWVHLWIWLAKFFRTCAVHMYWLMAKSCVAREKIPSMSLDDGKFDVFWTYTFPQTTEDWPMLQFTFSVSHLILSEPLSLSFKCIFPSQTAATPHAEWHMVELPFVHAIHPSCNWSIYKIIEENQTDMNAVAQELTLHTKQVFDKENITWQNMKFRIKLP